MSLPLLFTPGRWPVRFEVMREQGDVPIGRQVPADLSKHVRRGVEAARCVEQQNRRKLAPGRRGEALDGDQRVSTPVLVDRFLHLCLGRAGRKNEECQRTDQPSRQPVH